MREVAVIGAGELGGSIAHRLARRETATRVRLVDEAGRIAEGKALDIMQAAPIERFATEVTGSPDLMIAGGSDIVVIADRVDGTEWHGEEGLMLVRRVAGLVPAAIIVCAGWSQRDLVDRAVRELRLDPRRIVGSAPEASASLARGLTALAIDGSAADVVLTVLGNPPSQPIIPWDDAAVGGYGLARLVDEPTRRRLSARLVAMGPPRPHALAAAAVKAVEAILGRIRELVCCFVAPERSTEQRVRTTAFPVRLNWQGVEAIVLPRLDAVDQVALENVMLL